MFRLNHSKINKFLPLFILLISSFSLSAMNTSFTLKTFESIKKEIIIQTQDKLLQEGMSSDLQTFLSNKKGKFPSSIEEFQQFIKEEQKGKVSFNSLIASEDCPDLEFIDLRNVPGYPQIDDITACGAADTLSMIIFTGDPGQINGFEFEIDLPEGIEYAGFEFAQLGNTSISIADPSPSRPVFLVDGITGDSLVIVNIGIRANCEVDKSEQLFFDYNFEYIYTDTLGALHQCNGTFTPEVEFNSAVNMPVLNMLSPLSPAEATLGALSAPYCQTIQVSQDGLSSYVDSFTLEILNLDLSGDLMLTSINVNSISYPMGNIAYDAGTMTSSFLIDGSYFPANSFNSPADNQMNTGEVVEIEVCYQTNICPSSADLPFRYNAKFGCDDEICDDSGQDSFIRIRPTGALLPTATATLDAAGIVICDTPGKVSITLNNPNTDTDQNAYTDLQFGFQTCDKPNLDVTSVTVGGVSIPAAFYSWVGDDINIDFRENTDATIGLIDADSDGFFDDLAGGSSISSEVLIEISCGLNPEECALIDCQDVQYYVDAKFNCGNTFKDFPVPDAFDLLYGPTAVSNPTEAEFGSTGIFGYDFGTYSDNTATIATGESTVPVEFCYTFDKINIDDCPSGATNYFKVDFAGAPRFMQDLQFTPGTASWSSDGGTNYTPILDADVSFSKADDVSASLILNAGSDAMSVCYRYSITLDSCLCGPVGYFSGTQQVVSTCSDCVGGCDILKACRDATFRADPDCIGCDCIVEQGIHSSERTNFGYTDKTATTQHTRESLVAAGGAVDITRFMPGDTLTHYEYYVIKDETALNNINRWDFNWYLVDATEGAATNDNLDLSIDAHNMTLDKFQFSKVGVTNRSDVDFSSMINCVNDPTFSYGTIWNNFSATPWDNTVGHLTSQNSSVDYFDNADIFFRIWNYNDIVECGGNNINLGGETAAIEGRGNCFDEFINTLNIEVGDTIHVQWSSPLIINPFRAARKALGDETPLEKEAKVHSAFIVYGHDPIAGEALYCSTNIGINCKEYSPIFFDIAGEIDAVTHMTLDDCGGSVEHTFTVNDFPGEVGDPWFTQEYRPFMDISRVNGLIRAPLAYCANAQVDKLGLTYDVSVDSSQNIFCAPVTGYDENICAVNGDQATGNIFFNLTDQGIPALGIGFDNCDTIKLSYDLCMICPQDISGISEYDLFYDWNYVNTIKEREPNSFGVQYACNIATTAQEGNSICDEFSLIANSNWFEALEFDTLSNKVDRLSEVFLLIDNRNPQAPVTITNLGANLLASGTPGVSEEIQEVTIHNTDAAMSATGVGASVTVPSAVRLENVYTDAAGTMPLSKTLISDDGEYKIYNITLPSNTYAANEENSIFVGTTLLYCPDPNDPNPKICVSAFSGCAPEEVKAALGGSGGCAGSEVCYAYISGEVELQSEWFDLPSSSALCEDILFNVRIKNVKELILLDLVPSFDLPPGIQPISGSWEVSYPGGEVAPLDWQPIGSDPDIVSGNSYSYSDDALWSATINADGLEGVSAANLTADLNKVAFRFRATTDCDEFLSGSKLLTEATATDPCGANLVSSGSIESPSVIIDQADPEDYAQLLLFAEPNQINCMGIDNTFKITAINTGDKSTSDSVLICLTIPEELTYTPGSIAFASPSGFVPNAATQTAIGTQNELCFNGPIIGPYGSFTFEFAAAMDDNAECGNIRLGTDIKSFVEMVTCATGSPAECGVFAQNSLNSFVTIELTPPFAAEDLVVYTDCAADPANVSLYYEYTINHNGPDAVNQAYTVNFYEDLDGGQSVNSNIDVLLGSDTGAFSVNNGETVQVSGNIDISANQSCPVLFQVVYATTCACDNEEQYFDEIENRALIDYKDPITMCPGSCIDIDVCDYVSVAADSVVGASDVEYIATLSWNAANTYNFPRVNGMNGPPSFYVNYTSLTDNSTGTGDNNLLLVEQATILGVAADDAFIVASFNSSVNVDSVFIGGGSVSGWGGSIHGTYGGTPMVLEYSDDGTTWNDSGLSFTIPSTEIVIGYALPIGISAPFWRISSSSTNDNWAASEFRLEGSGVPYQAFAPVTVAGNVVTICIPDGVGIDAPWPVTFTTGTGDCAVEEIIEIWGIGTPGITVVGDTVACENQCVDLEAIIPNDATAGMTIAWTPAALISNPTAFRTEACNLTQNETFTATITYNDGACVDIITLDVEFIPEAPIGIIGEVLECYNVNQNPVITADTGWDIYNWYIVTPTVDYIAFSSTSNTFVPQQNATYYLNATRSDVLCPAASETFTTPTDTCEDYPDYEQDGCTDAPCHTINEDLYLGTSLTHETSPDENNLADRDEDNGVLFSSNNSFVSGNTMNIPIVITNNTGNDAYLRVWIDWNGDGDFTDAGEQIVDYTYDFATYNGTQTVYAPVGIPADVNQTQALGMRFRLSTDDTGSNMPCGMGTCASDGEVEDYLLRINCPTNDCARQGVSIMRKNP